MPMSVGLLTLHLRLPGCASLKEKRGRLAPLLARVRREFNLSIAEIDRLDAWQEDVVACAIVSNDPNYTRSSLDHVIHYIETHFPDLELIDQTIDLI
jgi:uncharacterized protein